MKTIGLIAILLLALHSARAQATEDSVKAAVNMLFTGMITSDSAVIVNSFAVGRCYKALMIKTVKQV